MPRTIGQLMGLVVMSALAMGLVVRRDQGATAPAPPGAPVVVPDLRFWRLPPQHRPMATTPDGIRLWDLDPRRDAAALRIDPRFTREARVEIDPKMVVTPPQGIDDAMIVDVNKARPNRGPAR